MLFQQTRTLKCFPWLLLNLWKWAANCRAFHGMRYGNCYPHAYKSWVGETAPCIKLKLQREPSAKQNFLLLSAEWKSSRRCKALHAQTIRGSCCLSLARPQIHHRASRTRPTFKYTGNVPGLRSYSGFHMDPTPLCIQIWTCRKRTPISGSLLELAWKSYKVEVFVASDTDGWLQNWRAI